VIWNQPPGPEELTQALKTVKPSTVILFAVESGNDSPDGFLRSLTGMVRYALRAKNGQVELSELAAALNQRVSAVEAGLRWLTARGFVRIIAESPDHFELAEGGIPDTEKVCLMETTLRSILSETAAFRTFYQCADPQALLRPE